MYPIKNFLFHRVNPKRDKLWDPMDVKLFEKCINFISSNYEVVLLEELLSNDTKLNSRKKYATIVFDDGYKDNIEYAAPILEKYKCKASFYVVTDCIDRNVPTWTHILEHLFQYTQESKIDIGYDFIPTSLHTKSLNSSSERVKYASELKPYLKKVTHEQRTEVLKNIQQSFNDVELPRVMMNWRELAELKNAGHYIGSHTITHCMLGTMQNEQEIWEELSGSALRIQQCLGHFPITISYPIGSYNADTVRLSQKAGYKIGLAVKQTTYNKAKDPIFEVPRIELYNESWFKTKLRITNLLEDVKKVIRYK